MTRTSHYILVGLWTYTAVLLWTTRYDLHRPVSVLLAGLVAFLHWKDTR
jgi:hypothetical protein